MKVRVGSEKGKKGMGNGEWGMGNGECGMGSAECGMKKISIVVSQPAILGCRFGINNPHSAFRIPYSLLRNFLTLFWQSGVCRAMMFKSTPARIACSKLIESIW